MALDLRANTAVDVLIGPFLDDTDGKTAETGLTITQADVRLSKNGQNIAQKNDANAAAHDELGYHNCPLNTADTNTEGGLVLAVHEAGALPVFHEYNILSEAAWDSLYVAKDVGFMDVNIKTVGRADAQETEANNLESACSNYSVTRGLTGTALPAVAADGVGGIPISDAGGLDLDAILADTNELQADWVNGGRLDLIQDIIAADTTTDIPGTITTMQNDLDIITGASGVVIQDGTIVAASLGADCITNAKIANDAIAAENLATAAISADAFAADALVAATFATGVFTADVFAANALVAATFNADCITAAKVAPDVHTENATAVWSKTESLTGNTHTFETVLVRLFRFFSNDMNITDATGAVALRNEANNADIATQGITDNDTTTARTDLVWS